MNNSNIKVYLGISFALIILFILILVIPFSNKKISPQKTTTPSSNQPFPTSVETNPTNQPQTTNDQSPHTISADFTGVAEEELPKQIIDLAAQKKELRQKIPLDLSTFTIDFDYSEDKFIVILKDPKDQAQKEFNSWRLTNYSGLGTDQFLLK